MTSPASFHRKMLDQTPSSAQSPPIIHSRDRPSKNPHLIYSALLHIRNFITTTPNTVIYAIILAFLTLLLSIRLRRLINERKQEEQKGQHWRRAVAAESEIIRPQTAAKKVKGRPKRDLRREREEREIDAMVQEQLEGEMARARRIIRGVRKGKGVVKAEETESDSE